jgi:xanthine dehydrogenase iron-sulfur cluster and FAD-binding subunit A
MPKPRAERSQIRHPPRLTSRGRLLAYKRISNVFPGFFRMKTAPFTRHVPRTVDDVVAALAEFAPLDGRILAGGQSLVPIMAFRMARPAHLIDINEVEGLDRLVVDGDALSIGARVRHGAFHKPVIDGPLGALMAFVAGHIAHYPIRMRGTFCGSLAHADPASEWCLVAATLGAKLRVRSVRGERIVEAADFLEGIMSTSLAEDEFLAEARLPLLTPETQFGFYEFSRRHCEIAGAGDLPPGRRRNRGCTPRYRRRRGSRASHSRGRSGAERPATLACAVCRRRRSRG